MQHDRPGSRPEDEADGPTNGSGAPSGDPGRSEEAQIRFLEEEIAVLRRKLTESPRHSRILEQRLAEASERVSQLDRKSVV